MIRLHLVNGNYYHYSITVYCFLRVSAIYCHVQEVVSVNAYTAKFRPVILGHFRKAIYTLKCFLQ